MLTSFMNNSADVHVKAENLKGNVNSKFCSSTNKSIWNYNLNNFFRLLLLFCQHKLLLDISCILRHYIFLYFPKKLVIS